MEAEIPVEELIDDLLTKDLIWLYNQQLCGVSFGTHLGLPLGEITDDNFKMMESYWSLYNIMFPLDWQ